MKEYSRKKANQKTTEEAIENGIAAAGTLAAAGVVNAISTVVELDPGTQGTVTIAVSTGVMGLIKTFIRRIRNRRKHRNRTR